MNTRVDELLARGWMVAPDPLAAVLRLEVPDHHSLLLWVPRERLGGDLVRPRDAVWVPAWAFYASILNGDLLAVALVAQRTELQLAFLAVAQAVKVTRSDGRQVLDADGQEALRQFLRECVLEARP